MIGLMYVIEQLGQALKASHEMIAVQKAEIDQLRAQVAKNDEG